MASVIDPLVNGFSVLLNASQRLMQKYVDAEVLFNICKLVGVDK